MIQGPTNILNHTTKLDNMWNMEVIGWKFFQIFVFILGVLGKRMLNPEVLKCPEDLDTLATYAQQGKTMDNKFYIYRYVKTKHFWPYEGPGGGGLQ